MSIIPFKGNSITLVSNEMINIYDSKNHLNKNYSYNIYSLELPTQ